MAAFGTTAPTQASSATARADPAAPGRGFWGVTTCAVVDWRCQTRLVELTEANGELAITCTMVDHDTPSAVRSPASINDLASLHRELAANMPFSGADSARAGTAPDRNVTLRLTAPFPLGTLTAGPERSGAVRQRGSLCPLH